MASLIPVTAPPLKQYKRKSKSVPPCANGLANLDRQLCHSVSRSENIPSILVDLTTPNSEFN